MQRLADLLQEGGRNSEDPLVTLFYIKSIVTDDHLLEIFSSGRDVPGLKSGWLREMQ